MERGEAGGVVLGAGESVGGLLVEELGVVSFVGGDRIRWGRKKRKRSRTMEETFKIKDGKEGRKNNDAFIPNGSPAPFLQLLGPASCLTITSDLERWNSPRHVQSFLSRRPCHCSHTHSTLTKSTIN